MPKFACACRNYSLPKIGTFLHMQCSASAVFAMTMWLAVWTSVRCWYCVKTAKPILKLFNHLVAPALVFWPLAPVPNFKGNPVMSPKTHPKWAWIGNFKPKKMDDGRHFENRNYEITQPYIVRSSPNFARRQRHRHKFEFFTKIAEISESKMAEGHHFENRKYVIISPFEMGQFEEKFLGNHYQFAWNCCVPGCCTKYMQIACNFFTQKLNAVPELQAFKVTYCDGSDLVLCTVDGGLRAIVFLYVFL